MNSENKCGSGNQFEKAIKEYLSEGRNKLETDLSGTREAIKIIARDKVKDFMRIMDRGLSREERDFLTILIIGGMYQSFCFGYGVGKMESKTNNKIFL